MSTVSIGAESAALSTLSELSELCDLVIDSARNHPDLALLDARPAAELADGARRTAAAVVAQLQLLDLTAASEARWRAGS